MLVPSIFSDNFFDDFFEFPFIDDRAEKNAERKLYGHHAANLMKTISRNSAISMRLRLIFRASRKMKCRLSLGMVIW